MNEPLSFWMPFDILKSVNSTEDSKEMRIAGYASTSAKDRQDDIIVQNGLDISDFVDYGFFNWNHDKTQILGYPDKAKTRIDSKGFYVEGTLLNDVPLARNLWELAVSLQRSKAPRKLGFSVEGNVEKRDALGKIVKAKVYNVAITDVPVNPNATWSALVKSFSTELITNKNKSITAGYDINTGDTNTGSCLKREDLEASIQNLARALADDEQALKDLDVLKACVAKTKALQKSCDIDTQDLILRYQLTKGLSRQEATTLVNRICNVILKEKEE